MAVFFGVVKGNWIVLEGDARVEIRPVAPEKTDADTADLEAAEALAQQYEQALLLRAEAMVRLKERGQDIAPLLNTAIA
jgi:hypothetical protein